MAVLSRMASPWTWPHWCRRATRPWHGGSISGSRVVDDTLMAEMERMCALAPAHNPVYLEMMRRVQERYPGLTQIACFETAFHATIPLERTVYGHSL